MNNGRTKTDLDAVKANIHQNIEKEKEKLFQSNTKFFPDYI